jgi:hypothetical protein
MGMPWRESSDPILTECRSVCECDFVFGRCVFHDVWQRQATSQVSHIAINGVVDFVAVLIVRNDLIDEVDGIVRCLYVLCDLLGF